MSDYSRRCLAACGTRPVRRLALLMASIGPVPTVEEMRAMIADRSTNPRYVWTSETASKASLKLWADRRMQAQMRAA